MPTRVVIAEDEAIIRLDLKETLEEEGYVVVGETGRGDEAVALVKEHEPDVAILDIKMPGLDGLSAASEITSERLAAVLILTAFSQRDLIEQARDAGALAYLVKPFQRSELVPAIEVAIGRFREMKALHEQATHLEDQLETRKVVDRAKGRLMDGHGLSEQDAFNFIQKTAMQRAPDDAGRQPAGARRRARPRRSERGRTMKLMLVDGNSLTYRAFFALPTDLATASGQVTNAVYGFTSMLINLVRDHQPDRIIVAFDRPEPTFRHDEVDTYKANRTEAPDILRQQMGLVRQVVEALALPIVEMAGFEADDVIATLATQARDAGDDVLIVTGDRDAYQLVEDPHIKVLYNKRGVSDYALYDEAGIHERTGVTPDAVRRVRGAARRPLRQPARACPGSGRRRRPSSSTPTAASTASSRRSTPRRRSCASPWPSTSSRCARTPSSCCSCATSTSASTWPRSGLTRSTRTSCTGSSTSSSSTRSTSASARRSASTSRAPRPQLAVIEAEITEPASPADAVAALADAGRHRRQPRRRRRRGWGAGPIAVAGPGARA